MALALLDTLKNKLFGGPKKECGSHEMKGSCGSDSKKGACHEEEEEDKASGGCCGGGCH